jgi:hypothetical protein
MWTSELTEKRKPLPNLLRVPKPPFYLLCRPTRRFREKNLRLPRARFRGKSRAKAKALHFSVDVQQDGGQRQQQQTAEQKRWFGGLSDGEEDEEQTVFRVDLDKGLLYWVA